MFPVKTKSSSLKVDVAIKRLQNQFLNLDSSHKINTVWMDVNYSFGSKFVLFG